MSAGAGAAQDSARESSRGGRCLNAANTLERELDGRRGLLGFWDMAAGRDVADRHNFSFGASSVNSRALRDSARRERSWASWCLSSSPSSSSPSQSDARNLVIRSASASLFAEHSPGQLAIGTLQGETCKDSVFKSVRRGGVLIVESIIVLRPNSNLIPLRRHGRNKPEVYYTILYLKSSFDRDEKNRNKTCTL